MDEEIKKKIEELEERIDDLENEMRKVVHHTQAHKHNIGDKLPTLNY